MANNELINEFIDEKAFSQFDKLKNELRLSQNEFTDLIRTIKELNIELSKSSSLDSLSSSIKKANDASEKMASSQKEQAEIYVRVAQAQEKVVEATRTRISVSAMDEAALRKVSGSLDEQIRRQVQLKAELSAVKEEQKELSKAVIGSDASMRAVTVKTTQLAKEEAILKAALQQTNLEIRRQTKEQLAAEGSSDQLSSRIDQLRGAYRSLSEEERNNAETGGVLLAQIGELDTSLKELDASQGVYNRNVGNYASGTQNLTNAVSALFPQVDKVKISIEKTIQGLTTAKNALTDYIGGIDNSSKSLESASKAQSAVNKATLASSKSLNIFKVALISTGIGAIVVALGAMIAYLTRTQEGIDKVTAITRPLTEVFKMLLGVVEDLGGWLIKSFTNPKKALDDLYNFVKNRILPIFIDWGKIMIGITTLNMDMIKDGINGFKDLANEIGNAIDEAVERGREIDKLYKDIERSEIDLIKTQGELNRTIEEQKEIARDVSKSEKERSEAAQNAINAINELSEKEMALQEKKIALLKAEQAANQGTLKDSKELAELEAERDNIIANAAKQRRRITNLTHESIKDDIKLMEIRIKNEEAAQKRIYELTLLQIDNEQKRNERLASIYKKNATDEDLSYDTRIENLELYISKKDDAIEKGFERERLIQEQKLNEAIELEKEGRNKEADAVRQMVEENLRSISEAETEMREQVSDENRKIASDIFKTQMQDEQRDRLEMIEQAYDAERLLLAEHRSERNISEEQFERERLEMERRYNTALLENEIATIEKIIEANKERGISTKSEEQKIADLKRRLSKQATDAQIEDLERLREKEKENAEIRKEIANELAQFATDIFNNEMDRDLAENERKQEELEIETEARKEALENEVLTEEERADKLAEIEADAALKRKELQNEEMKTKERQAKFERAQNISAIALNTARAVVSALPNIPLSVAVGAIGAAQMAYALSQPIPKFAKGTESSPEGLAFVGERGTEIMITPSGDIGLTPSSTTLTYLEKGTKVINAEKTKEILATMSLSTGEKDGSIYNYSLNLDSLIKEHRKSTKEIRSAILNKPEYTTILTERGLKSSFYRSKKWINYKNRLLN